MTFTRPRLLGAVCALGVLLWMFGTAGQAAADDRAAAKHVLLLSVDGMHQTDLAWFVHTHPNSPLSRLASSGVEFTRAQTPFPSDSFPGLIGQVTGGNPRSTGVYYDDSWNRSLVAAGHDSLQGRRARRGGGLFRGG